MTPDNPVRVDVAVVGGGPAGISACLELAKSSKLDISLFESEAEIGGVPRSCHVFFGLRDRKTLVTGPAYARKLNHLLRKTSIQTHANSTVLNITPGLEEGLHRLSVSSPPRLIHYESRFVIVATGCYESSREARRIPGSRPAGIFTTGALQQFVNLQRLSPGTRTLIVGSEHVALSSVLTLKRAGMCIAGLVEEDEALQTYPSAAKALSYLFGFPIYVDTSVKAILGRKRVECVELVAKANGEGFQVECDTVIMTGKFRPDSSLLFDNAIDLDPSSMGPVVSTDLMTSVPNIYAAGNVLRGADMHDLCALEGKLAAQSILRKVRNGESKMEECISVRVEPPIRYVVPQRIPISQVLTCRFSRRLPGFAIQVAYTLRDAILEAWSGDERIWKTSFSRLIGNTRIRLPMEKFDWARVDQDKGVVLRFVN
jgi:thioredoxin reductase